MNFRQSKTEPPIQQSTIDDYWMALYRQRWIVLLVAVASGALAWWLSGMIAPRYETTASFYVPGDVFRTISDIEESKARLPGAGLGEAKGFAALLEGGDAVRQIASEFAGKTPDMLYRDVDIVVSRQGIINIFVRDTNPEVAAQIANRYVSYFNDFHTKMIKQSLSKTIAGLDEQRKLVAQRKKQHEEALEAFEQKNQITSLDDEMKELEAKRTRHDDRRKEAEADLGAAQQRVDVLQKQLSEEDAAYRDEKVVLDNTLVNSLRQTMVQAEIDLAQKEISLTPQHPEVRALQARVEKARESLQAELQRIVAGTSKPGDSRHAKLRMDLTAAEVEAAVAGARVDSVRAADDSYQARAKQIPGMLRERNQYQEEMDRDKSQLSSLDKSRDDAQIELMRQRDSIVITQQATAPSIKDPVYPIPVLNTAVASTGGVVVGILYALLLNHIEVAGQERRKRRLAMSSWVAELIPQSWNRANASTPKAAQYAGGNGHGSGIGKKASGSTESSHTASGDKR